MTVRLIPVMISPGANFGGWNQTFTNAGVVGTGKNNVMAVADTLLKRYVGIRVGGTGNQLIESSTKAAPTVWSSITLPVSPTSVFCLWALPGSSPDTLLCGTNLAADARVYRMIDGVGFTNMNFPDSANSDLISWIGPVAGDADLFFVGNGCRNVAGSPQLWTFRLSTTTWTKIGGTGLNGSWTYTINNGSIGCVINALGRIYVAVGNGTANGFQVWTSPDMGASWSKLGGDGVNGSWAAANKRNGEVVFTNGKLYAGIGGTAGNAEVWECSDPAGAPAWTKIGDSTQWTSGTITNASEIAALSNKVVAGTAGTVGGDSQVWQFDTNTRVWVRLAVGTWSRFQTNELYVSPYDNKLFAGVGNNATGTANLFEVVAAQSGTGRRGVLNPYPVKVRAS